MQLLVSIIMPGQRLAALATMGLAACIVSGTGSSVAAQSLQDALVETYLTNPRLDSGRAELRATDELVPQARAGWLPTLFLNGEIEGVATDTEFNNVNDDDTDQRLASSIALTLNQSIYAGGGIGASVERSENLVRSERAQLIALEQDVLFDAVDAYTSTWQDRSVLDLSLNNEERLERQLQATRDRFEVGEVARTDVAQAEARLSRARADVEQAKADLANSTASYEEVIGSEPGALTEPKVLQDIPSTKSAAQEIASMNPNIV
ncbi:MAG: TolC family protein, partial [Pseudomonadota bacterium]